MTREDLLAGLSELLETDFPLTGSEELDGLGNWDSVAVMSFMAMADEGGGVTLAPKDIYGCKTVEDLLSLVRGGAGL